MLIAKPVTV